MRAKSIPLRRPPTLMTDNLVSVSVAFWPHWPIMSRRNYSVPRKLTRTACLRTACLGRLDWLEKRFPFSFSTRQSPKWHLTFDGFVLLSARFLFGGSVPHYFYKLMEKTLVGRTKLNQLLFLGAERFLYTPAFQALSLYTLAIFEVSAHFQIPK